ncbi:MAG: hypothetical protein H8E39_02930 [Alphaproteobacteria bacterium]|nr:hypothetical protein [Alphaproteobacteria bacterium]
MRAHRSQARSDLGRVIRAAEALGITEFDFFRLAYRRWSGQEPGPRMLESTFAVYMFQQTVPHWVRHLAREVNARAARGRLDTVAHEAMKYRKRLPPPRNGRLCVGAVVVGVLLYTIALMDISYGPGTSAPMPCYGGPGLKFFSEMAYSVSGQKPPSCEFRKDR